MNYEEMQETMSFILEQQKVFATQIAQITEREAKEAARREAAAAACQDETAASFAHTGQIISALYVKAQALIAIA